MPAQLPSAIYVVGGQATLTGYICPQSSYGFEEDSEVKTKASGSFNADITYSRRQTLSVTLEMLASGTPADYSQGGTIASGKLTDAAGEATAWKIRSATVTNTRGPTQVELDLISLTESIT